MSDADFRRLVDKLKSDALLSGVVAKAVKLKKTGHEYSGLCPFHQEKSPSFYVNDAKEFAHCFGCGWHGDVIKFVMDKQGCGFREAYHLLASDDLPKWAPQERDKAQAEARLEDLSKEQLARKIFSAAGTIVGTPAEVYLRARGITIPLPGCVRYGMTPSWYDKETGKPGRNRPALICGAQDGTGQIVGIQRIFFPNDDPRLGKAECKLSLGTIRGSAMRLAPAGPAIVMPEGPEDGFSIVQEGPGLPVWVPFGTSMMPQVQLPPVVRRVILAGQNNTASRIATNKAAIAIAEMGLESAFVWPAAAFDDWNDQLRGKAGA